MKNSIVGAWAKRGGRTLLVLACLLPWSVQANYTYQFFKWGPGSDDIVYGADDHSSWSGTYAGHTGTFLHLDVSRVLSDFVWYDMGSYTEGKQPPGPWRYEGTVTYLLVDHLEYTEFSWFEPGHEGDYDPQYYHTQRVDGSVVRTKTYAEPHPLWLTNMPVPDTGATGVFLLTACVLVGAGWKARPAPRTNGVAPN